MRNLFLTALTAILLQSPVLGQKAIVKSVTGTAVYAIDCKNYGKRLAVGDRLDPTGCIRLSEDASALIIYDGKVLTMKVGVDNRLADKATNAVLQPAGGFSDNLYRFITRSLLEAESDAQLQSVSAGVREKRAGIKGAAYQESPIQAGLNAEGEAGIEHLSFYWEEEQPSEEYQFRLIRQIDRQLMMEQTVAGGSFSPGRGKLALKAGEAYTWQVRSKKDPSRSSERITFTYNPDGAAKVLKDLGTDASYTAADPMDKLMGQAYVLEEAGYKADAAALWEEALSTYAGNRLVRDMAAGFFARMGLPRKASSLRR